MKLLEPKILFGFTSDLTVNSHKRELGLQYY